MDVKLELDSGIGDCLSALNISYPVQDYCTSNDSKCYVTYGRSNDCGWLKILTDNVFNKSDVIKYVNYNRFKRLKVPFLKDDKNYKKMPLDLGFSDINLNKLSIVLQLQGNDPVKHWNINIISDLIFKLIEHDVVIYMIDGPNSNKSNDILNIVKSNKLISTVGEPLHNSMNLVSKCDLLIAPDSWSKYIAYAYGVDQVILAASVAHMSDFKLLRYCFSDLLNSNKTTILGMDSKNIRNVKLPKHVDDISINSIYDACLCSGCFQTVLF